MPAAIAVPAIIGAAGVGASVYSGIKGSGAAKDAANAQIAASDRALDFQREQWNQQRADQAPWLQAGQGAIGQLAGMLGENGELLQGYGKQFDGSQYAFDPSKVQMDPGFDFRLQQGQKALERGAAARGSALGGAALKSLTRYAQDYSSNEYANAYNRAFQQNQTAYNRALGEYQQNYDIWNNNQTSKFNRLASLAGAGQTAATNLGNSGASFANAAAQTMIGQGNAAAAGAMGSANAWNNAISSGMGAGMNAATLWGLLNGKFKV